MQSRRPSSLALAAGSSLGQLFLRHGAELPQGDQVPSGDVGTAADLMSDLAATTERVGLREWVARVRLVVSGLTPMADRAATQPAPVAAELAEITFQFGAAVDGVMPDASLLGFAAQAEAEAVRDTALRHQEAFSGNRSSVRSLRRKGF